MKRDKNAPNVPTLRFAEYTDEWHKHALSDFVTRIKRRNKSNESSLPLTISAQYGLVDQITFFNKTVASVDLSGYYLLYNGDFAYNKSYSNDYAWGAVKRLDKYEKGCLSSLYFVFRPTDKVDSDYLTHYFETSKWHKGISDIAGEGARNHGLLNMAVDDYFATKHYLPSLSEQKKIACFLNLITKRIEIQNKIISKYETLIKGLCDRVFRHNKSIRLSDLVKCRTSTLQESNIAKYRDGEYKVFGASGVIATIDKYQFKESGILVLKDGSNAGKVQFASGKYSVIGTSVVLIPNDVNDAKFLYFALLAVDFDKYKVGSGIPHIYFKDYSNEQIYYPEATLREKINKTLSCYETKVETEKEMLSALQKQKTFLLKSMFI
ncbi:MAG TPA: restriction endonuclease subunit S [Firmicutes bacterium]|nr:restriction endonuclease subunit S [Bacillota bacterium]